MDLFALIWRLPIDDFSFAKTFGHGSNLLGADSTRTAFYEPLSDADALSHVLGDEVYQGRGQVITEGIVGIVGLQPVTRYDGLDCAV
jgi:hypothetical protein